MTIFVQIHLLVDYPAANLNRDDSGRPKTLIYGGVERLRVSSQSVKRALRTGAVFIGELGDVLGMRAQTFGTLLEEVLMAEPYNLDRKTAIKKARLLIEHDKLGSLKKEKGGKDATSETAQLAHLGPDEIARLRGLAARLAAGEALEEKEALVLLERPRAADIALFGRMLADNPGFNVEAAVQIAHAFTTHAAEVEDDYFTAVDEIKVARKEADRGAGFVGVQQYGAGVFYQYACLDTRLLLENLSGDVALAKRTAAALVKALAETSPRGKQNSFASRSKARYGLVEVGEQAPRTLASAFLDPIRKADYLERSVEALRGLRAGFDKAYDAGADETAEMLVAVEGEKSSGTLADLVKLAGRAVERQAGAA